MSTSTRSPHSADWQAWSRHLAAAAIKGAALAIQTTGIVSTAGTVAQAQLNLYLLAYAALGGFIVAVVQFLVTSPFPTVAEEEKAP